ncbi:hypothetical protein [Desulfospira joergensenii]|nr:hypothetical protein [Desulfospira joergensenii]
MIPSCRTVKNSRADQGREWGLFGADDRGNPDIFYFALGLERLKAI